MIPITGIGMATAVASGLIVAVAGVKFHRLSRAMRAENYRTPLVKDRFTAFVEIAMFVLGAGHAAAWFKLRASVTDTAHLLFAAVFLMDALLTYALIDLLGAMEDDIIEKKRDILRTFVNAIEMKDDYTKGHSEHVFNLVKLFCRHLAERRFKLCGPKLLDAALLHDIGKIGVSDKILNKAGALTDDEWAVMHEHPVIGKRLLDDTCFSPIGTWVLCHHERPDGQGYLNRDARDIPVQSCVIAIADAYSALTTDRAYRKAMGHDEAALIMREGAGTQFDAQLLACFLAIDPAQLRVCAVPCSGGDRHTQRT